MFYLNNLCSLCLVQNKKFISRSSIDSNAKDMLQRIIPEFLQQTSGIQKKLCDECLDSLTILFEFRRKCLENISIFDEYIRKLQSGHGSYRYLAITITDIKHNIKRVNDIEIIVNEDTCCLKNDVRTDCLEIDDNIGQNNSCNRDSNEEQEENDQKSDDALDIKEEISVEILNEDACCLGNDVRTDCLETDDNIEQDNSCNRDSNEEQEENYSKSDDALDIKEEISVEILNEDACCLGNDVRTDCWEIDDNIEQNNSCNRNSNEEQEENYSKSDDALDIKEEISVEILNEDACCLGNDVRTDCWEIDDNIEQDNSCNRDSNEEQEENYSKSDDALDIKAEISVEILNEDTYCLGNDVRTDCLEIDDNIEQNNSCNRNSNEEQEENYSKSDDALDIKEEISVEILNEDACCLGNDVRTDCWEIDDNIEQDNSCNRDSNEEQEENYSKSDDALDIKAEISVEILNEDTYCLGNDVRTDCLEIDDNIEQNNSCNRDSNEEQEKNDQKSDDALDIKDEISAEILNEDTCLLEDDFRTYCSKLVEIINQEHCYIREPSEEQDGNNGKSYVTLGAQFENDSGETDQPANQDVHSDERLKCTECGEEYLNHIHETDSPICEKCQTISAQNKSRRVRSTRKLYPCNTCKKSFSLIYALKEHEREHTREKHRTCSFCGKIFTSLISAKRHRQRVHPNGMLYSCNICHRRYTCAKILRKHQKQVHTNKYVCNICHIRFSNELSLRNHKLSHIDYKYHECNVCQKWFGSADHLKKHEISHTVIECEICKDRFSERNALDLHLKTHSVECFICQKIFKGVSSQKHHELMHTGQSPFKCNTCGKTFLARSRLEYHTCIHSCKICTKSFRYMSLLKLHEIIHTGEKQFSCDICLKKFRRPRDLRAHKRTHDHDKSFQCSVCGKLFRTRYSRSRHEKIHRKEYSETTQESAVIASPQQL